MPIFIIFSEVPNRSLFKYCFKRHFFMILLQLITKNIFKKGNRLLNGFRMLNHDKTFGGWSSYCLTFTTMDIDKTCFSICWIMAYSSREVYLRGSKLSLLILFFNIITLSRLYFSCMPINSIWVKASEASSVLVQCKTCLQDWQHTWDFLLCEWWRNWQCVVFCPTIKTPQSSLHKHINLLNDQICCGLIRREMIHLRLQFFLSFVDRIKFWQPGLDYR